VNNNHVLHVTFDPGFASDRATASECLGDPGGAQEPRPSQSRVVRGN